LANPKVLETRNSTLMARNSRCQGSNGRNRIPTTVARKLTAKATTHCTRNAAVVLDMLSETLMNRV
jgi:hypothetical protein